MFPNFRKVLLRNQQLVNKFSSTQDEHSSSTKNLLYNTLDTGGNITSTIEQGMYSLRSDKQELNFMRPG